MSVRRRTLSPMLVGMIPLCLSLQVPPALAQPATEWNPTKAEVTQLPKYCWGQFDSKFKRQRGYSLPACGERFNHFCPALVALKRASIPTASKKDKRYYIKNARDHLVYTRTYWAKSCTAQADFAAAERQLKMLQMFNK